MAARLVRPAIYSRHQWRTWLAVAVVAALVPLVVSGGYGYNIAINSGLFAILSLGFYFQFALAGQFSFATPAYYAIGAYTSAWVSINHGFLLGFIAGRARHRRRRRADQAAAGPLAPYPLRHRHPGLRPAGHHRLGELDLVHRGRPGQVRHPSGQPLRLPVRHPDQAVLPHRRGDADLYGLVAALRALSGPDGT